MHTQYPVAPEFWPTTPIRRGINPKTGLIEGDDSGYRKVRTLPKNVTPLVVPSILCRPSYDGVREDGIAVPSLSLPGGLRDGALVVREAFARDLQNADELLMNVYGGAYRLCALDGFRSGVRQAAGFTRMLKGHMQRKGLAEDKTDDRVLDFMSAGYSADGTFSWVNADTTSSAFITLAAELLADTRMRSQLEAYAAAALTNGGPVTTEVLEEAVYMYITISKNSGIGRAAGCDIPLVFENNAHAGGGACDVFLVDTNGKPLNHIPFDYPGPEAAMDYLEVDTNFDLYRAKAATDEAIHAHLLTLGLTPETFNRSHWESFRAAVRVLYHLTRAKNWTFYSSDQGGENWHLEGNNVCYDVLSGKIFNTEASAGKHADSGNPGHALQLHGRESVAVWGGASGHKAAMKLGLAV